MTINTKIACAILFGASALTSLTCLTSAFSNVTPHLEEAATTKLYQGKSSFDGEAAQEANKTDTKLLFAGLLAGGMAAMSGAPLFGGRKP